MNTKNLSLFSGVLLLIAIPSFWPYSFYLLLRWIIFASSLYIAYSFYNSKLNGWSFVFGGIAFIFNPILPIYLDKSSWVGIDLVSSVLFFISAYSQKYDKT